MFFQQHRVAKRVKNVKIFQQKSFEKFVFLENAVFQKKEIE